MAPSASGYTLVVCEKPDAAQRVAEALSDGGAKSSAVDGVKVFRFTSQGEDFVVCSAQGHVYAIADPFNERTVYPVFDVEWYPSNLVEEKNLSAALRINVIRRLAGGAAKFVNACDFDSEGETIGFNVLRYACGGKEAEALRAKFSTLTRDDVVAAFRQARPQAGQGPARAGRARHLIDFVWGVNLSRVLSQSVLSSGHRYRTISMGRVQGPTLAFLVERETEVQEFVPLPFWKVSGTFEKNGTQFTAEYSKERVRSRAEAEKARDDCRGKEGLATSVVRSTVQVPPPPPFSTGDLQKEAYSTFRFSPSRTLQVAERLYLNALTSYPRTSSQRLPPSINYRAILRGLERLDRYSEVAGDLLAGALNPAQGSKVDPAHPAIHPTGEAPRGHLSPPEASVFDLIVRRFLAAFGPPAKRELVTVRLSVGGHDFVLSGGRTLSLGWIGSYGRYAGVRDTRVPSVAEGDRFRVVRVDVEEKFERGPPRYNQSSLLEKMERENIGTKATRADIISTLVERGYVDGGNMKVTGLGLAVAETMEKYAPAILTTELTREIEERIEGVEGEARGDAELVRGTVRSIAEQLVELRANEDVVGREIDAALVATVAASYVLGPCPVCRSGRLMMIRSRKTKKRFVGCSNYSLGCRASAPLPQRGTVETTPKACPRCSWPVVRIMGGRTPWRLCVNPHCPAKRWRKGT
ncbi:MAG: DNA topoisomerase I [Nitrososphaerales archaeon]